MHIVCMILTPNIRSVLQCSEHSKAIEILMKEFSKILHRAVTYVRHYLFIRENQNVGVLQ